MSDNQENNNTNSEWSKAWHYAAFGGAPQGPITEAELKSLHKMGKINDATLIWSEGQSEWSAYSSLFPNLLPRVPGAPVIHGHSELATLESRLGAFIVDQLIAVAFIIPGALFFITPEGGPVSQDSVVVGLWVMVIGFLLYLLIQATKVTGNGQSMGKSALNIKIVGSHAEENPGFVRAYLIRTVFVSIISAIPYIGQAFFLVNISFIFRQDRRCLHDIMAGTKVVMVD